MVAKWNKVVVVAEEEIEAVSFGELERDVGFLVHISCTYPAEFPYLKGFYYTMNSWRLDRDRDAGWKFSRMAWIELLARGIAFDKESDVELPFGNWKRNFAKAHLKKNSIEI